MIFVDEGWHLMADIHLVGWRIVSLDTEELHAFAARIGLRRSWFQPDPLHPHYDLMGGRRQAAIQAGARRFDYRRLRRENTDDNRSV